MKKFSVQVGDEVAYSRDFGRSVGLDGPSMNAVGTVVAVKTFKSVALADIVWHGADNPRRVNVKNLAKPGRNIRYAG